MQLSRPSSSDLPFPVAREADQAGYAVRDGLVHVGQQFVLDTVVVLPFVQPVGQGSMAHDDGDVHARVAHLVPVLLRQHLDGRVAHTRRFPDERFRG